MMRFGRRAIVGSLAAVLTSALALPASALCTIDATPAISPATASTGTYTAPTAPIAQGVTFTVSGTYTTTNNINGQQGECTVALSFNRATAPITMARSGGGATMAYTVQSLSGGGNTLIYTGGGTPGTGNMNSTTFLAASPNSTIPFSISMTAYFLAQPVDPQQAGSYSDAITAQFFNIRFNGAVTSIGSRSFSVTGTVASSCTIGGTDEPRGRYRDDPRQLRRCRRHDRDRQILRQRIVQLVRGSARDVTKRRRQERHFAAERVHQPHRLFGECLICRCSFVVEYGDNRDGDGGGIGNNRHDVVRNIVGHAVGDDHTGGAWAATDPGKLQ